MSDDWSLEGKEQYYLDGIKIFHADKIEIARQKLIEDVKDVFDGYIDNAEPIIIKRINKRFGVKE